MVGVRRVFITEREVAVRAVEKIADGVWALIAAAEFFSADVGSRFVMPWRTSNSIIFRLPPGRLYWREHTGELGVVWSSSFTKWPPIAVTLFGKPGLLCLAVPNKSSALDDNRRNP